MRTLTVWLVVAVIIACGVTARVTGNDWWLIGLLGVPVIWLMMAVDW